MFRCLMVAGLLVKYISCQSPLIKYYLPTHSVENICSAVFLKRQYQLINILNFYNPTPLQSVYFCFPGFYGSVYYGLNIFNFRICTVWVVLTVGVFILSGRLRSETIFFVTSWTFTVRKIVLRKFTVRILTVHVIIFWNLTYIRFNNYS